MLSFSNQKRNSLFLYLITLLIVAVPLPLFAAAGLEKGNVSICESIHLVGYLIITIVLFALATKRIRDERAHMIEAVVYLVICFALAYSILDRATFDGAHPVDSKEAVSLLVSVRRSAC